jgi:hypothetical protein
VYPRRMPRMQVYLPADLYELVKKRGLPASELLQEAVRTECIVGSYDPLANVIRPNSRPKSAYPPLKSVPARSQSQNESPPPGIGKPAETLC